MNKHSRKATNGTIGLSVLALFAVAIIAGQADGNIEHSRVVESELPTAIDLGALVEESMQAPLTIDHEVLRKFKMTPLAIDFGLEVLSLSGVETDHKAAHPTVL